MKIRKVDGVTFFGGMVLLLFVLLTAPAWAQSSFTKCADEGGVCSFTGSKELRYGFRWTNQWTATRTLTGPVNCNNATLGPDPAVGYGKECQIRDAAVQVATVTASFNPSTVAPGASASLVWSSTGASSCTATSAGQSSPLPGTSGTLDVGPQTATRSVTVTCGTATATAALTVTAPPPAVEPLPLGTAKYEVKWTPAATNTDGTPIGTILSTKIQVSDTADFARTLEWANTGPGTGYIVSQAPNLPVLFWRAAHVTADGQSAWTTPGVRTERQLVEAAKPVCWPKPVGSGTWVKGSQNSDGWALYWQCTNTAGVASHAGVYGLWNMMDADWVKQLTAALAEGIPAFDTLWSTRASSPMDATSYAAVKPLWEAMRDANPLPTIPAVIYVVKPNGLFPSRPAYSIVDGARTSTLAGRVAIKDAGGVAQPCDCAAFSAGTDPNRYCAVTGAPNAATATTTDVLPASTAICSKAP